MNRTDSITPAADRISEGNQLFAVWIGLSKTLSAFTTSNRPVALSIAKVAVEPDLRAEFEAWESASDEDLAKFDKSLA
jgi:hypothetical protein